MYIYVHKGINKYYLWIFKLCTKNNTFLMVTLYQYFIYFVLSSQMWCPLLDWCVIFSMCSHRQAHLPQAIPLIVKCIHDFLHLPLSIAIQTNDYELLHYLVCMNEASPSLTFTKLRNPWGRPSRISNVTDLPRDLSRFASMMQSSKHGSMSTDCKYIEFLRNFVIRQA